jgi:hypothetical protein
MRHADNSSISPANRGFPLPHTPRHGYRVRVVLGRQDAAMFKSRMQEVRAATRAGGLP